MVLKLYQPCNPETNVNARRCNCSKGCKMAVRSNLIFEAAKQRDYNVPRQTWIYRSMQVRSEASAIDKENFSATEGTTVGNAYECSKGDDVAFCLHVCLGFQVHF
jgi:hypothetical protein